MILLVFCSRKNLSYLSYIQKNIVKYKEGSNLHLVTDHTIYQFSKMTRENVSKKKEIMKQL